MKLKALITLVSLSMAIMTNAAWAADIKFGAIYPFSGQLALLGEESARGLEVAVDEVNASGGIQGAKVVLVRGDAVDNNQAIGEARRLISVDKVKALFGTYSSARAIAASQVAELSGIPYFELGAVADEVTSRNLTYLYRANPTAEDMAQLVVEMTVKKVAPLLGKEPKDLKIGIIYEDSSYGTSVATHEIALAKKEGLNVITSQGYPGATVDLSSLVLDLKQRGVDIVYQTSYQNDSVLFLQQANEAGFKPSAIIGGGGGYSMQPTAEAVGHDVIENVLDVDFTQYAINTSYTPGIEAFVEAYKKKYGEAPRSGHSLTNYVGAKVIFDAMNKAKGFEPDTIIKSVQAIDIPAGQTAVGYGFKFGEDNQNIRASMTGMQWQNGKLVTVYPDEAAVTAMKLNQ